MNQSIISYEPRRAGKMYRESKAIICTYVYVTPEFQTPIKAVLSTSMARNGGARVYCDVYITGRNQEAYGAGSGFASGYGYDKSSAAVEAALEAAGVKLACEVGGRGERAVVDALEALAVHVGWTGGKVLVI